MRPSLGFGGTRAKVNLFQGTLTKEETENKIFFVVGVCVCVWGGGGGAAGGGRMDSSQIISRKQKNRSPSP